MNVTISGQTFEVVKHFPATSKGAPPTLNAAEPADPFAGQDRAIIKYHGDALVMARKVDGERWELAGPARPGVELDTLNALLKDQVTSVTVTTPDGSVKIHKD